MSPAATPDPPYWAAIFTTTRTPEADGPDYESMANAMENLAARQPGYLGIETATTGRTGITVSYWATQEDLHAWGRHAEHLGAQHLGRERWYAEFALRVARVDSARRYLRPD